MKQVIIYTREEWRGWLSENHDKEERVLLVRYKRHTGKSAPNNIVVMEEAICFGWIDTTVKRVDDEKYGTTYVRRKKTASWSNATQKRAREMIEQGKMTPAGLKAYKLGLKKKVIDHGLPRNPDVPKELKALLDKNKQAKENFEKFSPSTKRMYLYWILRAKRPETIEKRVKKVFQNSLENKKLGL